MPNLGWWLQRIAINNDRNAINALKKSFKVNRYTFRGSNSANFTLASFAMGSMQKGKNWLLYEQILKISFWKRYFIKGSKQEVKKNVTLGKNGNTELNDLRTIICLGKTSVSVERIPVYKVTENSVEYGRHCLPCSTKFSMILYNLPCFYTNDVTDL